MKIPKLVAPIAVSLALASPTYAETRGGDQYPLDLSLRAQKEVDVYNQGIQNRIAEILEPFGLKYQKSNGITLKQVHVGYPIGENFSIGATYSNVRYSPNANTGGLAPSLTLGSLPGINQTKRQVGIGVSYILKFE